MKYIAKTNLSEYLLHVTVYTVANKCWRVELEKGRIREMTKPLGAETSDNHAGWRKVPIEVYTPIGVQYPDLGLISCIFSSQNFA